MAVDLESTEWPSFHSDGAKLYFRVQLYTPLYYSVQSVYIESFLVVGSLGYLFCTPYCLIQWLYYPGAAYTLYCVSNYLTRIYL
jgi:hypothetical protein